MKWEKLFFFKSENKSALSFVNIQHTPAALLGKCVSFGINYIIYDFTESLTHYAC